MLYFTFATINKESISMEKLVPRKTFLLRYIVLSLLFINGVLFAENSITVPNQIISRHQDTYIPILGAIEGDKISFVLQFDAMQLNIKEVLGGENYLIQDSSIFNYINGEPLEESLLHISSENIIPNNDTICLLKVRALVCDTNIFELNPISLAVDDKSIENAVLQSGLLSLPTDEKPIKEVREADIGLFYPNPIYSESVLEFTIFDDAAKVEVFIFNAAGINICSIPEKYHADEFVLTDQAGIVQSLETSKIDVGRYTLRFKPSNEDWAQGAYFVTIKIDDKLFKANFIIQN